MEKFKIGVQLYSLRNELKDNASATISELKKWGVRYLEAGGGTHGLSFEQARQMLSESDLQLVSVAADYHLLKHQPQNIVEAAKMFDAKYAVCFRIHNENNESPLEVITKAVDVFNEAGKILFEHGVILCYHSEGNDFLPYAGETLFDYLVRETNPLYVNFEMDVYWVKEHDIDPVMLLTKYPGRFRLMHLKDRKRKVTQKGDNNGEEYQSVILGTGDIGIEQLMKVARHTSVDYFFVEDESDRAFQQIPKSIAYLKALNNEN